MTAMSLVVTTLSYLTWLMTPALAEEKTDKATQADLVAKQFATELLLEPNSIAAMKLTAVPFLEIEQGQEQKPKIIETSADLEKRIRAVVKSFGEIGSGERPRIKKIYDASHQLPDLPLPLDKISKEVFNAKTDRAIAVELTQDGRFPFTLLTFVSWREDRPKVVGYGFYYAR